MKKTLLMVFLLVLPASLFAQVVNTTNAGASPYATIQAAINNAATVNGDVITVAAGTYAENVVVNKSVTINGVGATSVIDPGGSGTGIGVRVTANNVTLSNFKVINSGDHGIYAGNVTGLTITSVTAMGNGTFATKKSGIALQLVTGTSVLTNVISTGNGSHGLEIGNGSDGVSVDGGTFNTNGVDGNQSTGGGVIVYADAGQTTNNIHIDGITANTNKTAGIYLYCAVGGTLSNTTIGSIAIPTLNDNGSISGTYGTGGAAVLVYGPCSNTTITANSTKSGALARTAGLVVLGTNASGANSPTNTTAVGCTLSGFSALSPAATMYANGGGSTLRCTTDVIASGTPYNTINGIGLEILNFPTDGYTVETYLYHKVDDVLLGRFLGPGNTVYVPTGGSINNGIAAADPVTYYNVQVQGGAAYAENVTINKAISLSGDGITTVIHPGSGIGINVAANGVWIDSLKVTGAAGHGIWADGRSRLTIKDVTVDGNGTGGTASGIAVRGITGSSAITNVTATNNTKCGLEVGNGTDGLQIVGGTFNSNGSDNISTGGGIMLYSDLTGAGNIVQNVEIKGTVTANTNRVAGIYIFADPGSVTGTTIGATGTITLTGNGSTVTGYGAGGAGILLYGKVSTTNISAVFLRSGATGAGLVTIGPDGSVANSPSATTLTSCQWTGYTSAYPAITLSAYDPVVATQFSPNDISVLATAGNVITDAADAAAYELQIFHKVDNAVLGQVVLSSGLRVKIKVFLEGPLSGTTMTTTLATSLYIPTTQTYTAAPFSYSGAEAVSGTSFFTTNTVVDWVLVQLRNTTTNIVETRAGLLKSDGTVIDVDATEGLLFTVATAGDYYIVVKHRNHLGIMSAAVVTLPNAAAYDFTTAGQAYGASPMQLIGTVYGMYTGEAYDNVTVFSDGALNTNDFDVWLPKAKTGATGYHVTDWNMDGQNLTDDFDLWLPSAKKNATSRVP